MPPLRAPINLQAHSTRERDTYRKMYDAIFARSFSKNEKRKLGVWAFLSSLLIGFTFCALMKAYHHGPLPVFNLQFSRSIAFKMLSVMDTSNEQKVSVANSFENSDSHGQKARVTKNSSKTVEVIPLKKFSDSKSDFCEISDGDIRIHGNSSTIFIVSTNELSNNMSAQYSSWGIRPYARKTDAFAMGLVREFSLKSPASSDRKSTPECTQNHSIPGIVFSTGGYAGNLFHDFSDIIVPLYITSRHFNGEVQFLVANVIPWWLGKYRILLKALSKYDIIDIDGDQEIHCFRSMTVGLKSHKEFGFDPLRPGSDGNFSMPIFTQFLRSVYSLERDTVPKISDGDTRRPRLYIMARMKTRTFVNVDELATEAVSLGFDVEAAEAGRNVEQFSKIVNSFDVMVTVHGAGLTNTLFLPQRAVVIQVVPLGLEWLSKYYFEMPARAMNLRYIQYKMSVNESTLIEKYPIDHPVIRDPSILRKQGWVPFRKVYLDAQNVRIDINKFRTTLLKALELLHE